MVCYSPLSAVRLEGQSKLKILGSKTDLSWKHASNIKKSDSSEISLPCGQCIGCRLEYSRQWAVRCIHESQLHRDNCFITLTYNDLHLPDDKSLHLEHFQKFMKRLRKRFGSGIRFYHCGEYGPKLNRPHYHALIFGFDFSDKELWQTTDSGSRLYRSKDLERLWPFGFSSIGDVTFESAAYVARYILKKQNGKNADEHYFDSETGVILKPEYVTMSRRPGIASEWFDKYQHDVYPKDFITVRGKKVLPPRYYDNRYKAFYDELLTMVDSNFEHPFDTIKERRIENAKKHVDNNTEVRLFIRHEVQKASLKKLPRVVE